MPQITGRVYDVGLDGSRGTLWLSAGFRTGTDGVIAPRRVPYTIVDGQLPDNVIVEPGPAYLEIDVGVNARGDWPVVIPDHDVTLRELIADAHDWSPVELTAFAQLRTAAVEAANRSEDAAEVAEAAEGRVEIEHEHVHQDVSHVDAVAAQTAALLEQANTFAQDQVPPYLQEEELNATYGTKAEVAQKIDAATANAQFALKDDLAPGLAVVSHGEDPAYPRPDIPTSVFWVGSVQPTGMVGGDLWYEYEPPPALFHDFTDGIGAWAQRWGGGFSVADEATASGGKALTASGTGRRALTLAGTDTDPHAADVEVVARVKASTSMGGTLGCGLAVRVSGDLGAETAYVASARANDIQIAKFVGGTYSNLGATQWPVPVDQWFWMRFRAEGTALRQKVWLDGEPEPEAWTNIRTDSAIPGPGGVGTAVASSTHPQFWDCVGVALDGGTAPTEA